jgi:FtsP/CotA-like multicopper oxidase with cupredoxin domain
VHLLRFKESRIARTARANREEIARAGLSRRDMVRLGLLSSSGYLVTTLGLSAQTAEVGFADSPPLTSPPTRAFIEPLPIPPIKQPVAALNPAPQVNPLPGEGRTQPHQAFTRFPPVKLYETHAREVTASFSPDLPLQTVWGYDGMVPGPTFVARYGEPMLVRMVNDLPQNHKGFGIPQITTHLHNAHTPSESDGFPLDFFPSSIGGTQLFYDQHHPMQRAGFSSPQYAPLGDPRETQSTLWYHDHRVDFTSQNVYKGLAGFFLVFSDGDTGDETTGYRLPSGEFDIPMILGDKVFDSNGQLYFDLFNFAGVLGDKFTVNGKIQPFLQVHPRRYRFRLLDGGPSRFYQLFLTDLNNLSRVIPFEHIANDGNLLPKSVTVNSAMLSVAERADVVVDFSKIQPGTSIYLENRLQQFDGRGPTGTVLPAGRGNLILRFDVVLPQVPDNSLPPPYASYPVPVPSPAELNAAKKRSWVFDNSDGQWTVNDRLFDPNVVMANPTQGTSEIWVLQNDGGEWSHPIHIHFEEFQMLSRNGRPPSAVETGRKDVARLGPDDQVRVFLRFRDFVGRYPIHCHNTVHEDHAMMARWDIVPG